MIMPRMCTIHQSQVPGIPSYKQQHRRWIRNSVTEKSRHFFDFSTISAKRTAPVNEESSTAELSIQPGMDQISRYLVVNIRSIVTVVAKRTWLHWKMNPSIT